MYTKIKLLVFILQYSWSTSVADFQNGSGDIDFKEINRVYERTEAATSESGRRQINVDGHDAALKQDTS